MRLMMRESSQVAALQSILTDPGGVHVYVIPVHRRERIVRYQFALSKM
jgi:hypothetical protein